MMLSRVQRVVVAFSSIRQWKAIARGLYVYRHPVRDLLVGYVLGLKQGEGVVELRTPQGACALRIYCREDRYTIHEIFAHEIYKTTRTEFVFLDLGGNIGVASAYFLSRGPNVRGCTFEPVPRNADRLRANLSAFASTRWRLREHPVVDGSVVVFHTESTGRYSGIDAVGAEERLQSIKFADAVANVLSEFGTPVEVLKIDVEGSERFYDPTDALPLLADSSEVFCEGDLPFLDAYLNAGFLLDRPFAGLHGWGEFVRLQRRATHLG
jgi:FkbM family methyltransferase